MKNTPIDPRVMERARAAYVERQAKHKRDEREAAAELARKGADYLARMRETFSDAGIPGDLFDRFGFEWKHDAEHDSPNGFYLTLDRYENDRDRSVNVVTVSVLVKFSTAMLRATFTRWPVGHVVTVLEPVETFGAPFLAELYATQADREEVERADREAVERVDREEGKS
jgi:hypothetical protein